ncbi:MAG: hypothetical protein E7613_09640 [Ruminococcaceae bacterium]|nr:hypothetical protein [Oscillospiraceae bacterium]
MKKRLQGVLTGILAGAILAGGVATAKNLSEKAEIYYRDIKIYIDGSEIVPKGSDGSVVEPFIMNGATYLPARALAEALGQDVLWDGKTSSVYIGKTDTLQPDNRLDKIQFNRLYKADQGSEFSVLYGDQTIIDCNNKTYTNGILFSVWGDGIYDDGSQMEVGYPLNSQYSKLTGHIVLPKDKDVSQSKVSFYGDGVLLHEVIVVYSMPFSFEVDVRGVNQLNILVATENGGYDNSNIALTDLSLYK